MSQATLGFSRATRTCIHRCGFHGYGWCCGQLRIIFMSTKGPHKPGCGELWRATSKKWITWSHDPTCETCLMGMGWAWVTNSQPVPVPTDTCRLCLHGFTNLWHSLIINIYIHVRLSMDLIKLINYMLHTHVIAIYPFIYLFSLIIVTITTTIFFLFIFSFFGFPCKNLSCVIRKHCMYEPVIVLRCHSFENRVKTSKPCIELLTSLLL